MSEYQYFEFAAVDGPISDKGLHYARGCSSRAEVSRMRWRNVYHFGDFHGSVEKLLQYYDAHIYIANWGTTCLGLALPEDNIAHEDLLPYLRGGENLETTLTSKQKGNRTILWWEHNREEGWWDQEGDGILDQLLGIREELLQGDYRALFLGWLADFDPDECLESGSKAELLPPVPAGLKRLSHPLKTLVDLMGIDPDALTVAAEYSQSVDSNRLPISEIVENLPVPEMRALLERIANGEGSLVRAELNRMTCPRPKDSQPPSVRGVEFAARIHEVSQARLQREAEAAEEKRRREAEARKHYLATVFQRADEIWLRLDALMEQKIASAYDKASDQIHELRDAFDQAGQGACFQKKLESFREKYLRRRAMMLRLEDL